jgi:hypothetical protein
MVAMDPERFGLDVADMVARAKGKLREAVAETLQDLMEEIVVKSPFEYGLLRGSWYLRLGSVSDGPAGTEDKSPAGSITVAKMQADLLASGLPLGETFYLLNNAAYAPRLEYGYTGTDSAGRTYAQEGRAFVRGTMAEAPRIARDAADRVASGQSGGANRGGGGVQADKGYTAT